MRGMAFYRERGRRRWYLWLGCLVLAIGGILRFDHVARVAPRATTNDATTAGANGAVCPALLPRMPAPTADAQARRCQEAIARAGRRYVQRTLAAEQQCLGKVQQGALVGAASEGCRGLRFLSSATLQLPSDAATAHEIREAEAEFRGTLEAHCSDATVAALATVSVVDGCNQTVAGLHQCLVADHWDHVQHVLEQQYGDLTPTASSEAQYCQAAIAQAGRRFLLEQVQATADCLTSHSAQGDGQDLAQHCIGKVVHGQFIAPQEPETAAQLRLAEEHLRQHLATACPYEALAVLDACGSDQDSLTQCLLCSHRREAMLLIGGEFAGTPAQPATLFIPWAALRNPILARPDRMLKDQAVAYSEVDQQFYLLSSTRFEPTDPEAETKARVFFTTRNFKDYSEFTVAGLNMPGASFGSPDLTRIDGLWHLVYQKRPSPTAETFRLFHTTSRDLHAWAEPQPLVLALAPDQSLIDGALAKEGAHFFLGFKQRQHQAFYVTGLASAGLTGEWDKPQRALAGTNDPNDPIWGFAENYQFIKIDHVWRMIATGRDPEGLRCGTDARLYEYACSHEPFIYTLAGDGSQLRHWSRWRRKTRLRIPYEGWNSIMHANAAFLVDWRAYDGFFYLFYAGAQDGLRFERRGHAKIGVARSRDLIHWRLPGDLRD
jgi:hypothetical protein